MRILMLGGTSFVGRHMVEAALARGHQITLFTRGLTNPTLFDVERLTGDRDGHLDALGGRAWDAVIDTSGRVPRVVRQSVELLVEAVGRYAFVSTKSVYAAFPPEGVSERSPVIELDPGAREDDAANYGGLKVLCERLVERAYGERALVLRPGLVVGPHDPTDRFTYWPCRLARGGEVLVPGDAGRALQMIDARDLAAFAIHAVERSLSGTYNVLGPRDPLTMGGLVAACAAEAATAAELTWVTDDFLLDQEVVPYRDLPLWMPPTAGREGFMRADTSRAARDGLTLRGIRDTVADTLAFGRTLGPDHVWRAGLAPERERRLLELWRSRSLA
jgi:2'-hydroxyisoflavone reductase